MNQKNDLVEYLHTFGLDFDDIESIKNRNSYFCGCAHMRYLLSALAVLLQQGSGSGSGQ